MANHIFVLMAHVVRKDGNDTAIKLKLREDCQLNLEKLKQHCKKEVKVLKEVSSNPHCSRYVCICICGSVCICKR